MGAREPMAHRGNPAAPRPPSRPDRDRRADEDRPALVRHQAFLTFPTDLPTFPSRVDLPLISRIFFMKLSAKAEYACLAVLELARRHDRREPARLVEIAGPNGIPERFL